MKSNASPARASLVSQRSLGVNPLEMTMKKMKMKNKDKKTASI
jgi:hypothetical protein